MYIHYLSHRAKSSDPWRARLTLVFVACLYGTNYTAIKFMGGLMDTSSLLTLRFGLAALVLLPALRGVGRDVLLSGAEVGVYAALGYGAQAYALTVRMRPPPPPPRSAPSDDKPGTQLTLGATLTTDHATHALILAGTDMRGGGREGGKPLRGVGTPLFLASLCRLTVTDHV